jgi:hypothetical protein
MLGRRQTDSAIAGRGRNCERATTECFVPIGAANKTLLGA